MNVILHEGDNRIALQRMIADGEFVDSVVCDPPYGLKSIIKRFGKEGSAPAKFHRDGAFARASKGFMGQSWDGSEIENDPEFWKMVYDVMKPGAYIVAFSSPRTYHLMATALDVAGFIVHPMIGWCYGSGMPKAHAAKVPGWEGWSYGGQARKPALEPIFIGQKPFSTKTGPQNILLHGVGAVNIDGVRPGDRWPANFITDGSLSEKFEIFERYQYACWECADSGVKYYPMQSIEDSPALEQCPFCYGESASNLPFGDTPVFYVPKAGKYDRAGSSHPTVKPIALIQSLIRHVTPPGGTVLDPFAGSGTTGQAAINEGARCILMENEKPYAEFIRRRLDLDLTIDDMLGEIVRPVRVEDLL